MPRDQRLYMTFPNDVHRHPKIMRLSVEARWAFIEMNGEARLSDNDGVFTLEEALFHWSEGVLAELCSSHPTRPLITRDDDGTYRIRDYAQHQQTRAERERLAEVSRENGRKGGRPKSNPWVTQTEPKETQGVPSGTQTKAEIEKELEVEKDSKNSSAPVVLASLFDDAYSHWPKKVERKKSFEKFKQAAKHMDATLLSQHIARFGDAYAATTERQFVPALNVWLAGERWADELPAKPVTGLPSAPTPRAEWCPVHAGWPHPDSHAGCDRCKEETNERKAS